MLAPMADTLSLDNAVQPEKCTSMDDVRSGVDALDQALVALLALRFGYMRAAARIKSDRNAVRDENRKAEVIANVRTAAQALGVPGELAGQIWEQLVEGSIAYELAEWDRLNG